MVGTPVRRFASRGLVLVVALPLASVVLDVSNGSVARAQSVADSASADAIEGRVVDASGTAIADALIVVDRDDVAVATTHSDRRGTFRAIRVGRGDIDVIVSKPGYVLVRMDVDGPLPLRVVLAATSASRVIGTVRIDSSETSKASVISKSIGGDVIRAEGYSRVGDALVTLPGVDPSPGGVHGSSAGSSLPLDIRGIGANETQVLFDGHPVGATGANAFPGAALFNGAPIIFDFQNSPADAIASVDVTYGAGAAGLYGVDSIGGVIDEHSLDPTPGSRLSLTQGFGNDGRALTNVEITGTRDRLGYVFVQGVTGTYGDFKPQQQAQIGSIGSDQTSANVAANTYDVSGNYEQRDTLAKLRYSFSDTTKLTLTGYSATSYADQSGNGDNDYVTYPYQLLVAKNIIAVSKANGIPTSIVTANGANFTCVGSIAAIDDKHPHGVCESPQTYARATVGPQGGGNGPFEALRTQDYHARFASSIGGTAVVLDTFVDEYGSLYDGTANLLGSSHENIVTTRGFLASDDIARGKNDLGFGYYAQTQKIDGFGLILTNATLIAQINPEVAANQSHVFVRDAYRASAALSFSVNGWLKYDSVSRGTSFDPRAGIVFSATPRDTLRLALGRSSDAPFAGLETQTPQFISDQLALQPACGGLTAVGSTGNPNLASTIGSDIELAFAHAFSSRDQIEVAAYDTTVTNPIFDATHPAASYANIPGLRQLIGELNAPGTGRYRSVCNTQVSAANLSVTEPINVGGGAFRGVTVGGRAQLAKRLSATFDFDLQSAVFTGVPSAILEQNPYLINGAQIAGIPSETGSLGFDYVDERAGREVRLDGNYVSANNSYFIGPYAYFNAFARQRLGPHATLTIGGINIFNTYSTPFGLIGIGRFQAENRFSHDTTYAQEAFDGGLPENVGESFGLPPPQITLSLTVAP